MKAILKQQSGTNFSVLHTDVIEIHSTDPERRRFKCLRCGLEWAESTNSPQVLTEEVEKNVEKYYHDIVDCDQLSKD